MGYTEGIGDVIVNPNVSWFYKQAKVYKQVENDAFSQAMVGNWFILLVILIAVTAVNFYVYFKWGIYPAAYRNLFRSL